MPVEYDWSGPIDCVPEHIPVFDHLRGHPNIFFGMGFNGTGIAQTPVGGRILASLVLERRTAGAQSGLVGLARRRRCRPSPCAISAARLVRGRDPPPQRCRDRQPKPEAGSRASSHASSRAAGGD